ncbi:dihydroorotase [Pseudodesulfovibrio piezophilus]|nr:amidohydrolase family protein [Pseudodesulfovibrio piezophilus]
MDLVVINGLVYREGRFEKTNVFIKDGIIEKIGKEPFKAATTYDAKGKWVLPGLIDPHVHFHLGVGETYSRDDFYTGSVLAAYGGVTTVIDFLNPSSGLDEMKAALAQRMLDAADCNIDFSFHPTIKGYDDPLEELSDFLIAQGVPSIKLFTTYSSTGRQTKDILLAKLCRESEKSGFTILIHAENNEMIDESPAALVAAHGFRRPPLSEISEVMKLAQVFEYAGGYGYIVHTNCGTTIEKLQEGFAQLLGEGRFLLESCPHYFQFDSAVYKGSRGYRYVMTPPLRPALEKEKLRAYIDDITTLATDHCPYREEEKDHACLDDIPNGIEGIPYTLPVLFNLFGAKVLSKMTHESAKVHGLYPRKGTIREGSDGDIAIFDPERSYTFGANMPWHEHLKRDGSVSPYFGVRGQGVICATFVRGSAVMIDEVFHENSGQFIRRKCR